MDIIKYLSNKFQIHKYYPIANSNEIEKLKNFSKIDIPNDYLSIAPQVNIEIFVLNSMYIRIWNPERCMELNEAYFFQKYIPYSLAIGDNEGGEAIVYLNGQKGFGLYFVNLGDIDIDEATFISSSLTNLLVYNQGIEYVLKSC